MSQIMKKALADSLKKLLSKRSIDKITVKDITDECGVNRQTFYYHFEDIYNLMEWILSEDTKSYLATHAGALDDWKSSVAIVFNFLHGNRKMIINAYDSINRLQYELLVKNMVKPLIDRKISEYPQSLKISGEKADFLSNFYTWGCVGLTLKWVEEGMPDEYQVHLDNYFIMIDGSIENLLYKLK